MSTKPAVDIPTYLTRTYWWAYVHPRAVRFFERQWLVDLILWGNFKRLRESAIAALRSPITRTISGLTLQVACVYGDLTPLLAAELGAEGRLDVVDVLPVQLANLAAKLRASTSAVSAAKVALHHADSTALAAADATYDQVLLFFLLHEQPEEARQKTLFEAWRVLKPGGRMVLVDYHEPYDGHPLKPVMRYVLTRIEPYAIDLWRAPLTHWLPPDATDAISARSAKVTWFGDLYQQLIITK